MYSSSIAANIPANSSPTEITAASGLSRFLTRSSTSEWTSGSSAISTCASKILASLSLPPCRNRSAVSESFRVTASTALLKRPSSSSTASLEMLSRSGFSSLGTWTKAGPTATPSEAATPLSLT
jgi:hypothetical protein